MSVNKIYIANTILRIIFIIGAVVMAIKGISGWGWLIFGAIVCGISFSNNDCEE